MEIGSEKCEMDVATLLTFHIDPVIPQNSFCVLLAKNCKYITGHKMALLVPFYNKLMAIIKRPSVPNFMFFAFIIFKISG